MTRAALLIALLSAACNLEPAGGTKPQAAPQPGAPSLAVRFGDPPGQNDPEPVAGQALSPAAAARLGGLKPGDDLAGFRVTGFAERGDTIAIGVERDGMPLTLWLVPKGSQPHPALRETATHMIYFGSPAPGAPAPEGVEALLEAIAKRAS